jgi:dihydrofolate synthase/folylpolyglutamate synthase
VSVLERLLALEQFGVKLGLDNIRTLIEALGHPERAWPCVLIAGTNGKGSVAAMVERALRASGRRTGRYTSPHLVHLAERFAIDGVPIDLSTLESTAADVLDIEAACRADGRLLTHATFFEVTTAIGFELFRRAKVDVAVLEVGLGGRFDATNVVTPMATAIVSIDIDHTRQLGSTLTAIAGEKAGIVKRGVPLVVGEMQPAPLAVIEAACAAAGAPIVHAAEGVELFAAASSGQRTDGEPASGADAISLSTPTRTYGPVRLGLAGRHQVANAIVAVRLLEELDAQGLAIDAAAIEAGLREPRWRGRLERVALAAGGALLLDAAHNPAGARALADHLREAWPDRPTLVFGASADKAAGEMIAMLAPVVGEIIVTTFENSRSASLDDLEAAARAAGVTAAIRRIAPARAALEAALAAPAGRPRVVVAGSIFLLGELLPHIDALASAGGDDRSALPAV